jgi:hypothetical protein
MKNSTRKRKVAMHLAYLGAGYHVSWCQLAVSVTNGCTKGGGALSQLESTIIPMAQILLGVVIYVNNMFLKIFGRHLRGFLGGGVGGWVGPTQVFGHVL